MPLSMHFLVFFVLFCAATALARQEVSASVGVAALKPHTEADNDAVAELIEWVIAAGGEAGPPQPCSLAFTTLPPVTGRSGRDCAFLLYKLAGVAGARERGEPAGRLARPASDQGPGRRGDSVCGASGVRRASRRLFAAQCGALLPACAFSVSLPHPFY